MPLIFKSLYYSLRAFLISIVFFAILTAVIHLLVHGFLAINFFQKLQKHLYLMFYFILITPLWLLLLPFFSPYIPNLSGFWDSLKVIVAKLFIYSLVFVAFGLVQYSLSDRPLNNEDIVITGQLAQHKLVNKKYEFESISMTIKKQIDLSLYLRRFVSPNNYNNYNIVFIICFYSLYLLGVALFENMGKNAVHHYLRNIGLSMTVIITFLFFLNWI